MFSSESQPEALNMRGIPQSKLIEFDELIKKNLVTRETISGTIESAEDEIKPYLVAENPEGELEGELDGEEYGNLLF